MIPGFIFYPVSLRIFTLCKNAAMENIALLPCRPADRITECPEYLFIPVVYQLSFQHFLFPVCKGHLIQHNLLLVIQPEQRKFLIFHVIGEADTAGNCQEILQKFLLQLCLFQNLLTVCQIF